MNIEERFANVRCVGSFRVRLVALALAAMLSASIVAARVKRHIEESKRG